MIPVIGASGTLTAGATVFGTLATGRGATIGATDLGELTTGATVLGTLATGRGATIGATVFGALTAGATVFGTLATGRGVRMGATNAPRPDAPISDVAEFAAVYR